MSTRSLAAKKLELKSSDIGKYYTNENSIYIDEIKIDRKSLKYSRFSSFRGQCEAFRDKKSFEENFNIDNLIKDNKNYSIKSKKKTLI